MGKINVIGIDLAKEIFHLHAVDEKNQVVWRKKLRRKEMLEFFINLEPVLVVMEACGGSNYWAQKLIKQGHQVKLIAPSFVKPFVKSQKNDRNDAEAIVEASSRPSMRYVSPKEMWQQDIQSVHRVRTRLVRSLVDLMNQARGLLMEYGITIPEGVAQFRKQIPLILEDAGNELSSQMRTLVRDFYEEYLEVLARKKKYDQVLDDIAEQNEDCKRLLSVPGVGPLTSTMFVSAVGDANSFKNGRQVSAWLGLVPRQISTGGKTRLAGITKRGDTHLRSLLVHGARSEILACHNRKIKSDHDTWVLDMVNKKGYNKTAVALANRKSRQMWAMLKNKEEYQVA